MQDNRKSSNSVAVESAPWERPIGGPTSPALSLPFEASPSRSASQDKVSYLPVLSRLVSPLQDYGGCRVLGKLRDRFYVRNLLPHPWIVMGRSGFIKYLIGREGPGFLGLKGIRDSSTLNLEARPHEMAGRALVRVPLCHRAGISPAGISPASRVDCMYEIEANQGLNKNHCGALGSQ